MLARPLEVSKAISRISRKVLCQGNTCGNGSHSNTHKKQNKHYMQSAASLEFKDFTTTYLFVPIASISSINTIDGACSSETLNISRTSFGPSPLGEKTKIVSFKQEQSHSYNRQKPTWKLFVEVFKIVQSFGQIF